MICLNPLCTAQHDIYLSSLAEEIQPEKQDRVNLMAHTVHCIEAHYFFLHKMEDVLPAGESTRLVVHPDLDHAFPDLCFLSPRALGPMNILRE